MGFVHTSAAVAISAAVYARSTRRTNTSGNRSSQTRDHGSAGHIASMGLAPAGRSLVVCCGSVFVAADMRAEVARAEPALFPPTDWVFEEGGEPPLLM